MKDKLRQKRLLLRLSQEEVAKKVGVARQTINMIENGEYNPTLALCLRICHVLGSTLDELFWED